jgi:hypothetical protein
LGFKEEYDSLIHPIPTDSSYVFWFRISRELLGLDEDVVCGIVYIPPEYTVYSSVDVFSELENEYLALQRNYKYIFLNGDFNSRTAKDPDFIYIENNNDNIDFFRIIRCKYCKYIRVIKSNTKIYNMFQKINGRNNIINNTTILTSQFTNTFVISNPSIYDK